LHIEPVWNSSPRSLTLNFPITLLVSEVLQPLDNKKCLWSTEGKVFRWSLPLQVKQVCYLDQLSVSNMNFVLLAVKWWTYIFRQVFEACFSNSLSIKHSCIFV
jgi:hypothetical protein